MLQACRHAGPHAAIDGQQVDKIVKTDDFSQANVAAADSVARGGALLQESAGFLIQRVFRLADVRAAQRQKLSVFRRQAGNGMHGFFEFVIQAHDTIFTKKRCWAPDS